MAKVPFSKLSVTKNDKKEFITWGDQTIEIKQYLPFGDKIKVVEKIVNQSIDDHNYANPARKELYEVLEIIFAYTNISFTEKQKEDPYKLFDLLVGSGLMQTIWDKIPDHEIETLLRWSYQLVDQVYNYSNSARGIMEAITEDYSDLNLDAEELQKNIADPENLAFLKEVMEKLG